MRRHAPQTSLQIRPATPADAPTILRLVRDLAEYEGLSGDVRATVDRLRRHGFGRRPFFQTLICRREGRPIGFALYLFSYSTFLARPTLYVEDLFVVPEERGRGAGRALFSALARIAMARGCGRMEWVVLRENEPGIRFYEQVGAQLRTEWILTRLTGPALRRLALSNRAKGSRNGRNGRRTGGPLRRRPGHRR
jgi:GNAT superfamily N-acetyltransferase